ncbi:MAG: TPM domain-containing protein [Leptospirales bacterium]|nr:TPM domain-containing protein [Leptospirales bacterium]
MGRIGKRGKDNGLLVLPILDQRRVEIETGYGMEGDVPDVAWRPRRDRAYKTYQRFQFAIYWNASMRRSTCKSFEMPCSRS